MHMLRTGLGLFRSTTAGHGWYKYVSLRSDTTSMVQISSSSTCNTKEKIKYSFLLLT